MVYGSSPSAFRYRFEGGHSYRFWEVGSRLPSMNLLVPVAALIRDFADSNLKKTKLRKIHCLIGLITCEDLGSKPKRNTDYVRDIEERNRSSQPTKLGTSSA